ncbi:MAG: DNA polymerase I [Alphaproteobacteria bacterium]|nr:DNA polymerase I [Alphaproteobacteria bacterium]
MAAKSKTPAKDGGAPVKHLCLIDGSGYIFRAFFAIKTPMTRADGTPVGAVFGFCSMLWKLLQEQDCDHLAVIFDAGRRSFRNEIYPEYKAHRPEPPPELVPQFGLVREATRAFNLPAIESAGFEADDLIATYARQAVEAGAKVTIISSDKDLMQLIRPGVAMFDPLKNKPIGEPEVLEKFGVAPAKVVDVQSLAGDSTDNVPGVPGIGVKTAAELIATFGDLDTLLARAGEIKQPKRREALLTNADKARVSRELVRLKDDCSVPVPLDDLVKHRPDPAVLRGFLEAQNFRSLLARFQADGSILASDAAPGPAPAVAANGTTPTSGAAAGPATSVAAGGGGARYVLIQDDKALDAWIARAIEAGQFAVDTETTSLDAVRAELVGISLAIEPGEAAYIPLAHVKPGAAAAEGELALGGGKAEPVPGQLKRDAVLGKLKKLLEDPAILKIGHNIKYDAVVFASYGIDVAPIDDTMLISYVLEGGAHGHGMDELANLHLGHTTITYDDVTGTGKGRISFAEVALDKARDYAAEDAEVTLRLHRLLKPRLVPERLVTVYETIERPLVPIVAAMERAGVMVDREQLRRLSNDFALRLDEYEKKIHKAAGRSFNIGSPAQLGTILFDEMSLQLPDGSRPAKTKTGAYSTGAEVLEDLAAAGHALPQLVLDWRQLAKLKSTYTDALMEQINPDTGRVHTSFAMAATSTGRLSSSDPNLQNIPVRTEEGRKIRTAFVAEEGWDLVSLDYSQIELRLLAHVAGIDVLREAFRKGDDIHAMTASEVFGVPIKGMSKEVRNRAKAINFGIIYGISAFGLARQLSIPQGEARAYIDAYFKRYPGIRAYMDATKKKAHEQGYVTTLLGRRCHVPGIASKNPAQRSFSERAAINAPIQGGAADIIKRAMIRIPAALARAKLSARMLLQVHDELLFEVKPKERDRTIEVVRAVMEGAAKPDVELTVPLVVEAGHGRSWAEAH